MSEKDKYQLEVDKNYDWYLTHKDEILKNNPGKDGYFLIIKNQKEIGLYKTFEQAKIEAIKKFDNNPYSIQELLKKERINSLGFVGLKWEKS